MISRGAAVDLAGQKRFIVKNVSGKFLASFFSDRDYGHANSSDYSEGIAVVLGNIYANATPAQLTASSMAFGVTDATGAVLLRIDSQSGNMYLKGDLAERDGVYFTNTADACFSLFPEGADASILSNAFLIVDHAGNLHLRGKAYTAANPDRSVPLEQLAWFEDFEKLGSGWGDWTFTQPDGSPGGSGDWSTTATVDYIAAMTANQLDPTPALPAPHSIPAVSANGDFFVTLTPDPNGNYPVQYVVGHGYRDTGLAPDNQLVIKDSTTTAIPLTGATVAPDSGPRVYAGTLAWSPTIINKLNNEELYGEFSVLSGTNGYEPKLKGYLLGPNHFLAAKPSTGGISSAISRPIIWQSPTADYTTPVGLQVVLHYQIPAEGTIADPHGYVLSLQDSTTGRILSLTLTHSQDGSKFSTDLTTIVPGTATGQTHSWIRKDVSGNDQIYETLTNEEVTSNWYEIRLVVEDTSTGSSLSIYWHAASKDAFQAPLPYPESGDAHFDQVNLNSVGTTEVRVDDVSVLERYKRS